MDIFLFICAALLMILGVVGSVVPGLPGPPLGYVGLLLLQATEKVQFSTLFLVIWALVVVAITVVDYFFPIWTTKRIGGSKYGIRGSFVGMIVGIVFTPVGIILGTLLGAIVGEMIGGSDFNTAMKSGVAAFAGTMLGTGIKLIVSVMFCIYFIIELF